MRNYAIRWLCIMLLLLAFLLGPMSSREVLAPTKHAATEVYRIESVEGGLGEKTPAHLGTLTDVEERLSSGALLAVTAAVASLE